MANGKTYTEAVLEFKECQERLEQRLMTRLDSLNDKIEDNGRALASVCTSISEHERRLGDNEKSIDDLKDSDRRWGATTGVLAVLGSIVASIIGVNK